MNEFPNFMDDYSRGMIMLRLASESFATLAAGLGYPIPDPNIPTAQVSLNIENRRVEFKINPDFIASMKDSEVAVIIAHETYHVLLDHFSESADSEKFPRVDVLIHAQECIINDGIPGNLGFTVPAGGMRGEELYEQDFSLFSSKEGYDFILSKLQEEEPESDESSDEENSEDDSSDDESDSNSESQSKNSEDNNEGDSEEDENSSETDSSDESDDGSSDKSNNENQESDAESDSENSNESGNCGGVSINGNSEELSSDELKEVIREIMSETLTRALDEISDEPLPNHVQDLLEDLESKSQIELPNLANAAGSNSYSENKGKDGFNVLNNLSGMSLKWIDLLSIINPKIKSHGKRRNKDSWHAPRRRMLHSYPEIVLPTNRRKESHKGKGDSIPSMVLALDMSGSIPAKFLDDLASFALSLPENLIKGFPITWSDNYRVFDPENPRQIVQRSGTRISTVIDYANRVEKETGVEPYVLVITDGGFRMPSGVDSAKMKAKWFWMALEPGDLSTLYRVCGNYAGEKSILNLRDFI